MKTLVIRCVLGICLTLLLRPDAVLSAMSSANYQVTGGGFNSGGGARSTTGGHAIKTDATGGIFGRMTSSGYRAAGGGIPSLGSDPTPPSSTITSPSNASVLSRASYAITGTASDSGSGVAYVDVSTNGGKTWSRAAGTTSWTYNWIPLPASGNWHILSRATDNAGNVEKPGGGVFVTITTSSDTVWAWGENDTGDIGDGTTTERHTPVQVSGLASVVVIAGGYGDTIALKSDGTVWAWGWNIYGQLGNGTSGDQMNSPGQVNGLMGVTAIAGGGAQVDLGSVDISVGHTVALKSDGTVYAWGCNRYGQLGDGTTDGYLHPNPVQVSGLTGITAIAAGGLHTAALKSDGTVWAWGWNNFGQLGNGTSGNQMNSPVQVSGLDGVTSISAGRFHTLALKSDGTVWAWGANFEGELGGGTTTGSNVPVQVSGLSGITAIAGGHYHSIALKADGTVWAWGANSEGELGDGTTTGSNVPVQVSGLSGITAIAGGTRHSIALKADGTVWTWGYNNFGQLGDGTMTDRHTPVQVSGLSGVTAIAGGNMHTIALKAGGIGGGTPELPHYNWDAGMIPGGTDCTACHAALGTFQQPGPFGIGNGPGFCYSCHNAAGNGHALGVEGKHSQYCMLGNATSAGRRRPVYGNITAGERNDIPANRLVNGYVKCATCHNSMKKSDDPGRVWELTSTGDRITYRLLNGGWSAYGNLTPKVYRDTTLWGSGGPTYSKAKKGYLVDPSEYAYNELSGFVRFKAQQSSSSYIYVTLYYPYLRAPMQDNALCSDCHTEATHREANCLNCHQSHNTSNIKGIRDKVRALDYTTIPVKFLRFTGINSFADGNSTRDGVCEVCHTKTKYYRRDGSGLANHTSTGLSYAGKNCAACHSHATGFAR